MGHCSTDLLHTIVCCSFSQSKAREKGGQISPESISRNVSISDRAEDMVRPGCVWDIATICSDLSHSHSTYFGRICQRWMEES